MRRVGRAVEVSSSRDKLVWLVVRDIARLSPCKRDIASQLPLRRRLDVIS